MQRLSTTQAQILDCYGLQIGIQSDVPHALELLARRLAPVWRLAGDEGPVRYSLLAGPDDGGFRICRGGRRVAGAADLAEALSLLESLLHQDAAMRAPGLLFVHAGAVGWKGRLLILPGRSRSGKSTLVEALVRRGAVYFSDEYAVVDERGRVHPYPIPLSLRGAGSTSRRVPPEELGKAIGERAWPVGLIAAVRYRPGARWSPVRLSPGEGVLALLAHTVAARARPRLALQALGEAAAGARCFRGFRGDADETAAALLSLLHEPSRGTSRPRAGSRAPDLATSTLV